jgi:hypothetical protein
LSQKNLKKGKKGKYQPILARLGQKRAEWEDKAPRLTEDQKQQLQRISRGVFMRHANKRPTRRTFNEIHERIENELGDKISSQMGLKGALEWRLVFGKDAIRYFAMAGMPNPVYVDGILPTDDFVESELFDYVELFEPVLSIGQFEDYNSFISSTEEAVAQAEARRKQGDAYFTDLDKAINYRAPVAPGDELE